jgi:hypothetical protein
MAQSGRNAEMAAGLGSQTLGDSSAFKASSSPTMSMDTGAAKNTGATTMPGAASGKIGVGNSDRGGMPNLMSIYQVPAAGSMPAKKEPSAPKIKAPSNPSSSGRGGGFRMGGMIGWGSGGGMGMGRID